MDGLFDGSLPQGFRQSVVRLEPGCALAYDSRQWSDALVLVLEGEIELECRAGACRRYGRGAMLPLDRLPLRAVRNAGSDSLVLVAISRDR